MNFSFNLEIWNFLNFFYMRIFIHRKPWLVLSIEIILGIFLVSFFQSLPLLVFNCIRDQLNNFIFPRLFPN